MLSDIFGGEVDFDSQIPAPEKAIIELLEEKKPEKCPFLAKEEKYFYYCNKKQPSEDAEILRKHVSSMEMQFWCMDKHKMCVYYPDKKQD